MPSQALLRLAQVAAAQHGLVTRGQALDAGFTARQVDLRISLGSLVVVRRGVLALVGTPPTWLQAVLAARLAAGDDVLVSHATAARVLGLAHVPDAATIHLLTPGDARRSRLPGVTGHRSVLVVPADRGRHSRIDVTSPARTLVDCAADLGADRTGRALDDALRRELVSLEEFRATAARLVRPGRSGGRALRTVLSERLDGYDPGDSDLEVAAIRALVAAGLPCPVQQHPILVGGRVLHVDLAYPDLRIAIELDGWEWHRHRSAFDRDRRRLSWLAAAGWTVLVATSRSVSTDLVPQVEAARAQRTRALSA